MILWYLDRLGLPPSYRIVWTRLLNRAGLSPLAVKTVSLHRELNGTLLARYKNRAAPTWNPIREPDIVAKIREHIAHYQPKVIVLGAPEALAILGMDPEHATLLKLRGSVYEIDGIPTIVILPISAWVTQVSIKDFGAANYGETDEERFEERVSHDGVAEPASDRFLDSHDSGSPRHGGRGRSSGDGLRDSGRQLLTVRRGAIDRGSDGSSDSDLPSLSDSEVSGDLDDGYDLGSEGMDVSDSSSDDSDWEEEPRDEDSFWYEPVVVPVGRFMLFADISKLSRLYNGRTGEMFNAY